MRKYQNNIVGQVLAIIIVLCMVLPACAMLSGRASAEIGQITPSEESLDSFTIDSQQSLPLAESNLVLPTIGSMPFQWNETRDPENETDVPLTPRGESTQVNITTPTPPPAIPEPSKELIVLPNPDFTIKSLETTELTILNGDTVSGTIFIDNVGLLWFEEIPVAIYDGVVSPENLPVVHTAVFEEFSTVISFVLTDLGIGTHQITVFVDPYDEVEEQNENNNTATFIVKVTTTEDEPSSITNLIKTLMAKVNVTMTEPYSGIINLKLIAAIAQLEDAEEEFAEGDIEDAIESINDAIDRVHKAAVQVQIFYNAGKISLLDAQDIWRDAGIILERLVDLARLYLDDPFADDIAKAEKYILEIITGAMIEIPDDKNWVVVYAHLSASLNRFQEALDELAEEDDPAQTIQKGYDMLILARDKLSTLMSKGKIPEEFGNHAIDIMEKALLLFAPDLSVTRENIVIDKVASVGERTEISVVVKNAGRTDIHHTIFEIYDETEQVLLASRLICQLKAGSETTFRINWIPSTSGTHYLSFKTDPNTEVFELDENNNQVTKGFYVTSGTTYVGSVHIPSGKLVRWDSTNTTITDKTIVVSGNITIDGTLRVGDGYTVIMNCTFDNQYMILVNPTGELNSNDGNFASPSQDLTYSFLVGGRLTLLYSTVQWVYGEISSDVEIAGGIQLYSNNVDIENSEIFEGKSHGIFVFRDVVPNIISHNTIRNNGKYGILYLDRSGGIIDNNNISSNTYGVYCYRASPTITNNKNISWNTNSGIYNYYSLPTITNNENISWNSNSGIYNYYSSPSIIGNYITGNQYGIDIRYDSTALIEGNTIVENQPIGVYCQYNPAGASPIIRNNPLFKDNTYGVYAYHSSPLVENNVFTGHWQAILGQFSSATVHKNNIYDNSWGIEVWDSPSTFVASENTVTGNTYGLWSHNSDAVFKDSPDISENDYGIFIRMNSNPTVTNNTITANRYGIYSNQSSPSITDNDISLNGVATIFFDDMESGIKDWTADGFWHQVENITGAPSWNLSHSATHSWWYGLDATGNYDYGKHNFGNLTSKFYLPINSTLSFWSWYEAEPGYDVRSIWINVSGGGWQMVERYENYVASMYDWKLYNLDLSAYGNNNVQIRFSFDTLDEIYNDYQGWYIDDIRISTVFGSGVHLDDSSTSVFSGNEIKANGNGIAVIDNSNVNLENNNIIDSNIVYGIYTENSTLNIRKSIISYNHFGVYSRESIGDGINANTVSPEVLSSTSYDLRTTFDDKNSETPTIVTYGDRNYMVWADDREGNYEIYLMERRARNSAWGYTFQKLSNTLYDSIQPDIVIDSNGVWHVVWKEVEPTQTKICYVNSLGTTTDLYVCPVDVAYPQIAMGDVLQVVFIRAPSPSKYPDANIYHIWSDDEGNSWELLEIIGNASAISPIALSAVGTSTRVAWQDWDVDYFIESVSGFLWIFYPIPPLPPVKSFSWGPETRLVDQPGNSTSPSLGAGPGITYLVWSDDRTGDNEIYLKSSIDLWISETRLTYATGISDKPKVSVDSSGNAHILWQDDRDGMYKIHYLKADLYGIILTDDTTVTPITQGAESPECIIDDNDYISIVWQDQRDNNWEIYTKYFSPVIENCEISNNSEIGICIYNRSSLMIKDSLITSNGLTTGTLRWWIEGVGVLSSENTNLVMHNTSVRDNYFGVWVSASSVYAINNDISYNAARGFLVYDQSVAGIINNTIHDNWWSGFSSSQLSTGVIMNNTVIDNNYGFYLGNAKLLIIGNNISSNTMYGIFHKARAGVKIVGNSINDNGADGIMVYSFYYYADQSVYIYENEILRNGWDGIYSDLGRTIVYNNTISYNTEMGVWVGRGYQGSYVANNTIEWNGMTGVVSHGSNYGWTYTQVKYNTINNNSYGVALAYIVYSSPEVFNNNITDNTHYGISSYFAQAHVFNNKIDSNDEGGIYWDNVGYYSSLNPIIENNTITNNGYGIYTHSSALTIIDNSIGTGYNAIENETVIIAQGGETGPFNLNNENILNCTLYIDESGSLYKMEEWNDYTLNYDTGVIDFSLWGPLNIGDIVYTYYNYTTEGSNTYGIYSVLSEPTINDNTIGGNSEEGIYINNQMDFTLNPIICDNIIIGNNQGINILDAFATVTDNDIILNRGTGVSLENGMGEIATNNIFGNNLPGHYNPPEWELSGIDIHNSDDVWIHHNNVSSNGVNIYLDHSTNIIIEWNTIVDASAVIMIYPTPPPPRGIYSISSQMCASNNTIWGTIFGIEIMDADETTIIRDNKFYPLEGTVNGVRPARGVYLDQASARVEYNTFDRIGTGIHVLNSEPILRNNLVTNSGTGIYLKGAGDFTVVRFNNLDANGYGIWYEQSTVSLIVENNLTNNEYGLYATSLSETLTAWSNNIFGNTEYGVYNNDTSFTIDVRFNWWGDPTGAWHPINYPFGQGDWVSDNVNADFPEPDLVEWW